MPKKSVWDEFNRLQKEMNNFFKNHAFSEWEEGFQGNFLPYQSSELMPPSFRKPLTDIYETKDHVIARMEIPGVEKKDIDISTKGNSIEVKVERKNVKKTYDNKKGAYHYERIHTGFYRYITMPSYAKLEELKARYKNGILELEAPKDDKNITKGKKVTVK